VKLQKRIRLINGDQGDTKGDERSLKGDKRRSIRETLGSGGLNKADFGGLEV
jgi:hypothetical protein